MKKIKSLSVANFISFLIHALTFYAIHFQLINLKAAHQITNPYHSLLSAEEDIVRQNVGRYIHTIGDFLPLSNENGVFKAVKTHC